VIFKQLQKGLEDLADKSGVDRKSALAKMNDLAKSLEKRRDQLGGADQMRDQLNRLRDIQQGPADRIAKAVKDGDFPKALEELKKLQEQLKNDQMKEDEKQQLVKQLEQLRDRLQEMVDRHEQAKRDMQEEIQRRQAAGDLEGAGRMQRQLDQFNAMNDWMNRMQQMADSLDQCKQCLQEGQGGQAAAGLDQLAESLEQLQDAMDQLETLDQIMDDIAMAKDAMGCEACDGRGCEGCMGGAFGWQQGQGNGIGDGQGFGERPEEQTDTRFYESQVRGEVRQGAAVVTGTVGGPNRAGRSLVETREAISGAMSQDPDPLIDLQLPKTERDHTRQYFESLRDGVADSRTSRLCIFHACEVVQGLLRRRRAPEFFAGSVGKRPLPIGCQPDRASVGGQSRSASDRPLEAAVCSDGRGRGVLRGLPQAGPPVFGVGRGGADAAPVRGGTRSRGVDLLGGVELREAVDRAVHGEVSEDDGPHGIPPSGPGV
jgi:hypothetical protein